MNIKMAQMLKKDLKDAVKSKNQEKIQELQNVLHTPDSQNKFFEQGLTGYASIDQPWLKQYKNYDESKDANYIQNQTVWDVVERLLEKYSYINFIEYFGRDISRETFASYVEMWARTFRALGVEPGDTIPIYTPATPEAFAMFLAAVAIGAKTYYQKIAITKEALEQETKGAKIAVVFDGLWKNVKDVFSQDRFKNVIVISAADSMMFPLKQIMKMKSYFEQRKSLNKIPNDPKYIWTNDAKKIANYYTGDYKVPFEPGRIATITTSSGTTSNAVKGIMDTNEGILASLRCTINAETGYTEGKRTYTCFPPTASTSLNCLQLLPTVTGGTIIFDPRVEIEKWYERVTKQKPDITISTGSVWERFVQDLLEHEKKTGKVEDLSWIDYFIMGGSGTNPEILNSLNSILRSRGAQRDIQVGYGFSEVFGVLSVAKYNGDYKESENTRPVISVGIPLPGYEVGIFDENGKELPYGQGYRGELWIKAPSNMEGYFGKEDITKATIVDGWIHSGDLCELDSDGNIYYYGRLKNNINVNDNKLYLFDISNDIRAKFKLHDIFVEKKKMTDGTDSLVVYFSKNADNMRDSEELMLLIDQYVTKYNIRIDGYKEFEGALPIDPTTLKLRNKDLDGFRKYKDGTLYDVLYCEEALDTYSKKEFIIHANKQR